MGREFEFDTQNIGVCIKDADLRVLEQNELCKKFCNDQCGKLCEHGCINEVKNRRLGDVLNFMPQMFYNVPIFKRIADLLVMKVGQHVITLLFDSEQIAAQLQKQFLNYGLSKTENKILRLYLLGKTNVEIADKLFISKSTLRTHLNNIYKKIPHDLQMQMQRWHLSRRSSNAPY